MNMKVKSIVKEYIDMQEEYVEILKKFLQCVGTFFSEIIDIQISLCYYLNEGKK